MRQIKIELVTCGSRSLKKDMALCIVKKGLKVILTKTRLEKKHMNSKRLLFPTFDIVMLHIKSKDSKPLV